MDSHEMLLNSNIRLRFGDTRLISEFADQCSGQGGGTLFFTAPFYDSGFLEWLTRYFAKPRMQLEVVVRDVCAAEDLSKQLLKNGCKSVATYICNRLHAKVYIFETLRHDLSLVIGSHNPTRAGISTNLEVGVC